MDTLLSTARDRFSDALNSFAVWVMMWVLFALAIVGVLAWSAGMFATPVMAATPQIPGDGIVVVPWGDWLIGMLEPLGALAIAIIMWTLRRLPASIYLYLQMLRAEQLIGRAINYALSATAGAVAGKELSLNVTAGVLENAAEYAVKHAPDLVKTIGGPELLKEKVLARLSTADDVSAASLRKLEAL